LQVAFGSACELEAELLLARDLGYLPDDGHTSLLTDLVEVKRMLGALASRTFARAGDESRRPSALSVRTSDG
jgi:four helix bundle protein